jgi:uncharacterized protein YdhG (YjbR/CyaY superfamily)
MPGEVGRDPLHLSALPKPLHKKDPALKAYFDGVPPERQQYINAVRETILRARPGLVESMQDDRPTYSIKGKALCALANQKNYMALYIMPYDLLSAFKKDLRVYDRGRTCIRFRHADDPTLELVERIVKYTGSIWHNSTVLGKHKSTRNRPKRT